MGRFALLRGGLQKRKHFTAFRIVPKKAVK